MTKWEYLIATYGVTVGKGKDKAIGWGVREIERLTLDQGLNALGEQGWELVHIMAPSKQDNMYLYFKRQKPAARRARPKAAPAS